MTDGAGGGRNGSGPSRADLDDLVREPRETLDVEVKAWLDLTTADHKALVAKEIIALANHGGGYLVVGFDEQPDGSFRPAPCPAAGLAPWSQDGVQAIVAKYIEPAVQCRVIHPAGLIGQHPVIVVPGGHRVPIRARAGSPDGKLQAHRIYIRRPGPASEEPRTAEEWDRFFERCVRNRQAELVDAMRSILAGTIPSSRPPTRADTLSEFASSAIGRWTARIDGLPAEAGARMVHGHYDFAAAIEGVWGAATLPELRDVIQREVRSYTGWPAFLTLNRAPYAPVPIDGAVEFWRGPDTDGALAEPAYSDFWRVSPEGLFFTRRGLPEDSGLKDAKPGAVFDLVLSTWRVGEAILEVAHITRALKGDDADLILDLHYTGLAGRTLVSYGNQRRWILPRHKAAQDTYAVSRSVALSALPESLPEVVHALLAPLYELFDFYQLPKSLVEEELAEMRGRVQ